MKKSKKQQLKDLEEDLRVARINLSLLQVKYDKQKETIENLTAVFEQFKEALYPQTFYIDTTSGSTYTYNLGWTTLSGDKGGK